MLPERPVAGIAHPGAMGAALGAALQPTAGQVLWAVAGRSQQTAKRAELADLVGVPDIAALARRTDLIISICPPHAAEEVAGQVAAAVTGSEHPSVYVDANAVAPQTVRRIADRLGTGRVVDGAVIGPPGWRHGTTVLWLSGPAAGPVAELFAGSPFQARVLGAELGTASALKACFALQSKALPAMWLQLAEAADAYGVTDALRAELDRNEVDVSAALESATRRTRGKEWRWAGEMDQAAEAFAAVGLPEGFSRAAAELYRLRADTSRR